jgi:hypothetical protein
MTTIVEVISRIAEIDVSCEKFPTQKSALEVLAQNLHATQPAPQAWQSMEGKAISGTEAYVRAARKHHIHVYAVTKSDSTPPAPGKPYSSVISANVSVGIKCDTILDIARENWQHFLPDDKLERKRWLEGMMDTELDVDQCFIEATFWIHELYCAYRTVNRILKVREALGACEEEWQVVDAKKKPSQPATPQLIDKVDPIDHQLSPQYPFSSGYMRHSAIDETMHATPLAEFDEPSTQQTEGDRHAGASEQKPRTVINESAPAPEQSDTSKGDAIVINESIFSGTCENATSLAHLPLSMTIQLTEPKLPTIIVDLTRPTSLQDAHTLLQTPDLCVQALTVPSLPSRLIIQYERPSTAYPDRPLVFATAKVAAANLGEVAEAALALRKGAKKWKDASQEYRWDAHMMRAKRESGSRGVAVMTTLPRYCRGAALD